MSTHILTSPFEGILLVNKQVKKSSFSIVHQLRKLTNIKKIGHAGTLDPFARGVMVMLIGRSFTRMAIDFQNDDKQYSARLFLGSISSTYDPEGEIKNISSNVPSLEDIEKLLQNYQGLISQIPPMFSAKKVKGQRLYHLARKGKEIEREPIQVEVEIKIIKYSYPFLDLHVQCSKGTYIRSIAHDIGKDLGCGAYLISLTRTRSGPFLLKDCIDQEDLISSEIDLTKHIFRQWKSNTI